MAVKKKTVSRKTTKSLTSATAKTAKEEAVVRYLKRKRVDPKLLEVAFLYNKNLSEATLRLIVQHAECPDKPLLAASYYCPGWEKGSAALALRHLEDLEAQANALQWYEHSDWPREVRDYKSYSPKERIKTLYLRGHSDWKWSVLGQCQKFILDSYLADKKTTAKDLREMAQQDDEFCQRLASEHSRYGVRRALAQSPCLKEEFALLLATDKSPIVRVTLAKRKSLPASVIAVLVEDKRTDVAKALRLNKAISARMREKANATVQKNARTEAAKRVNKKGASQKSVNKVAAKRKEKSVYEKLELQEPKITAPGLFKNKRVVVTGYFDYYKRDEIEQSVKEWGGIVRRTVYGNTDWLIVGDDPWPPKINKALELGTMIMDEDEYMEAAGDA